MRNFLIGQHGGYDENKQKRDFRQGFWGVQGCQLNDEKEIKRLLSEAKTKNFKMGVHFPMRAGVFDFRDPLFLSHDKETRCAAFASVEKELEYLRSIKPIFVLFHYPKPVILDDRVDWKNWRFSDSSEYVYESNYSYEELKERSEYLFKWLSEKSVEYNFIPVLEFDALNKYIYESTFLDELLGEYPQIKLCLDTGRLHIQSKLDRNFNIEDILKRFAKHTYIVHLWNAKVTDRIEHNHYPVMPGLKPEEGWAAIDSCLKLIVKENLNCLYMFEHRSDLLTDEELEQCYQWVDSLVNNQDS